MEKESLKKTHQWKLFELKKLSQESQILKGRKPREYAEEERAAIEMEHERTKMDMEQQIQFVRESAQKYQQTLVRKVPNMVALSPLAKNE